MNDPHDNAADDKTILAKLQPLADADVPGAPCNDPDIREADDNTRFCLHCGFNAEQHKSRSSTPNNTERIGSALKAGA